MNSGIYKILNIITGNFYIGSSSRISRRKYTHFHELKNNKHHSIYLQEEYNKYGLDSFKFIILSKCAKEYLLRLEQWFINNLKPTYNKLKVAGTSLGYKHTEEALIKLRNQSKSHLTKPVYQYDSEYNLIKIWNTYLEYSKFYKVSREAISKSIRKGHRCGGYYVSNIPL